MAEGFEIGKAFVSVGAEVDQKALDTTAGEIGSKLTSAFGIENVTSLGHNTASKFAAGAQIGFAGIGTHMAAQVDTGVREINTLFGKAGKEGEKNFNLIKDTVSDLSNEMGVAQTTLVSGLYQAISAGVPKENAFEFMKIASKAAIAGVSDTETAVDGLTTIINAFGLKTEDAERVADSMFQTVKGGKTNFAQLSDAMFNVAPLAAAAGISFEEVNASIATLTSAGVPTSVATTQIRAAIQGLTAASDDGSAAQEKHAKAMAAESKAGDNLRDATQKLADLKERQAGKDQLTIADQQQLRNATQDVADAQGALGQAHAKTTALADAAKNGTGGLTDIFKKAGFESAAAAIKSKGLAFALDIVKDAAHGDLGKMQELLGSVEAVGATNVIAGTGAAKMAAEMEGQANAAGATDIAFQEMNKGSGRVMEQLKTQWGNLAITIGEAVLPSMKLFGDILGKIVGVFTSLPKPLQQFIGGLIFLATVLGPPILMMMRLRAVFKLGKAVTDVAKLGGGVKEMGVAGKGVVKQLAAVKTGMLGLKIGQFGKALGNAFLHPVKGVKALGLALKAAFVANPAAVIIIGLVALGAALFVLYKKFAPFTKLVDSTWQFIQVAWDGIMDIFGKAFNWIKKNLTLMAGALAIFTGPIGLFVLLIVKNWDTVKGAFMAAFKVIKDVIGKIVSVLVDVFGAAIEWIVKTATTAWDAIKKAFSAAADFLSGPLNFIKGLVETVWGAIMTAFSFAADHIGIIVKVVGGIVALIFAPFVGAIALLVIYWDQVKFIFEAALNVITTILGVAWDVISTVIKAVWDPLAAYFEFIFNVVKTVATVVFDALKIYFTTVFNIYKTIIMTVWNIIRDYIIPVFQKIWDVAVFIFDAIKAYFTLVFNIYKAIITTVWDILSAYLAGIWRGILAVAGPIFDALKLVFTTIFDAIKLVITTIFDAVKLYLETTWNGIKWVAETVWNLIKSFIITPIQWVWDKLQEIFNAVVGFLVERWETLKGNAERVWNLIKDFIIAPIQAVWTKVQEIIGLLVGFLIERWENLKTNATNIFNGLKDAIVGAFQGVADLVGGIWDKIWGFIKGGINTIIDGINGFLRFLKGIKIDIPKVHVPGTDIDLGGGTIGFPNIPEIPRLAKGGTVLGEGLVDVGEKGPERLFLPRGARVEPLSRPGGDTYHIDNVTISARDIKEMQDVADFFKKVRQVSRQKVA